MAKLLIVTCVFSLIVWNSAEEKSDPHCSITPSGRCMCCYNGDCDVDLTQRKCSQAPAPAPACQHDPHCSIQKGRCRCCYNGDCAFDQQCKCLSTAFTLDSEATALPNLTGSLAAAVQDAADPHCSINANGQCMCCYPWGRPNGGCEVEMLQTKCGVPDLAALAAPVPACQHDPRCSIYNGQCRCCRNGDCEIDQQCKCQSAAFALDSEAAALPNLTGSLAAAVQDEVTQSRSHLRR